MDLGRTVATRSYATPFSRLLLKESTDQISRANIRDTVTRLGSRNGTVRRDPFSFRRFLAALVYTRACRRFLLSSDHTISPLLREEFAYRTESNRVNGRRSFRQKNRRPCYEPGCRRSCFSRFNTWPVYAWYPSGSLILQTVIAAPTIAIGTPTLALLS